MKTNAARLLDSCNIHYELREYPVDIDDLGAENVAAKVGMPLEQVYKTLVARGDRTGVLIACISGADELDLKALAAVSDNKKVEMVPLKEVQTITGYIRGGVSPLGMKKKFPVFIDNSAINYDQIAISAGIRGCQLLLEPRSLADAAGAVLARISRLK